MLVDTHCHLGQFEQPGEVLRDSIAAGIGLVVATENPDEYRRLRTRLGGYGSVSVGIGLHPASEAARNPAQVARFFRLLPDAAWVSEIGLDFGRFTSATDRRNQTKLLESMLEHGLMRSKVASVHSRGAAAQTIDLLQGTGLRAIMHWYSGSLSELERGVDAGLHFSVNEPMLKSQRALSILSRIPLDRLHLETDGPFASSSPGVPSSPAALRRPFLLLASLLKADPLELESQLEKNLGRLTRPTA